MRKPIIVELEGGRVFEIMTRPPDRKGRSRTQIYRRVARGRGVRVGGKAIVAGGVTRRKATQAEVRAVRDHLIAVEGRARARQTWHGRVRIWCEESWERLTAWCAQRWQETKALIRRLAG